VGEIVNLRRMKKRRERAAAATTAQENRVRHGRTAVSKANDQRAESHRAQALDALRREDAKT
jgi:hypothetical protein